MIAHAHSLLARLMVDREGVTAMEYGVIAAGIVLAVATAAATLGSDVSALSARLPGRSDPAKPAAWQDYADKIAWPVRRRLFRAAWPAHAQGSDQIPEPARFPRPTRC
jgi:pilus assembly protein Flp/PilA